MTLKTLDKGKRNKRCKGVILSESPDDVRSFVKNHLPIRVEKKDSNGEVFTPRDLVCKMLDAFPNR